MAGKSTKSAGGRKTAVKKGSRHRKKRQGRQKRRTGKKRKMTVYLRSASDVITTNCAGSIWKLYGNDDMFAELCGQMKRYYDLRNDKLKKLDAKREAEGEWYRKRDMVGMMMYIDNFAGNIKGVQEKLPYLESCNVNYIHLMPFLDSPKGRSDGGYAVADFRKVKPDLGTHG